MADIITKIDDNTVEVTKTIVETVDVGSIKKQIEVLTNDLNIYQSHVDAVQAQIDVLVAQLNSYKEIGVGVEAVPVIEEVIN